MLSELTARLLGEWALLWPGTPRPQDIEYLGVSGSLEGGTTTFLGFARGRARPLFAVKVHRSEATAPRLSAEREVLHELDRVRDDLGADVPRLILADRLGGAWVSVQSIVGGRPMPASLSDEGVPDLGAAARDFGFAAGFLAALRRATLDVSAGATATVQARAQSAVNEVLSEFRWSDDERLYLVDLRTQVAAALGPGAAVQHGDFCRHNILIERSGPSRAAVIDWTDCTRHGAPLHDFLFFMATYYLQIRAEPGLAGFVGAFEGTFLNPGPYRRLVHRCLLTFCERSGVPASAIDPLVGLFLVERTLSDLRQVRRCVDSGSVPRLTLYLAMVQDTGYADAEKRQFWCEFLRSYIARRREVRFAS